jgi:hypothetical protein
MPVGTAGSRGARPPIYLDHRCSCFNLRAGTSTKVPLAIAGDDEQKRSVSVLLLDDGGSDGLGLALPQFQPLAGRPMTGGAEA